MQEKPEIIALITKWWVWLCYILLGIVAQFSYALIQKRKISIWQALGQAGISIFIGVLASLWCQKHSPENGALIVPIATLLSDKIIAAFYGMNLPRIFSDILGYWQDYFKPKK